MGAIDCPICETVRHIDDTGQQDRCWACGWPVPVDKTTGAYKSRSEWPSINEQERRVASTGRPMTGSRGIVPSLRTDSLHIGEPCQIG